METGRQQMIVQCPPVPPQPAVARKIGTLAIRALATASVAAIVLAVLSAGVGEQRLSRRRYGDAGRHAGRPAARLSAPNPGMGAADGATAQPRSMARPHAGT